MSIKPTETNTKTKKRTRSEKSKKLNYLMLKYKICFLIVKVCKCMIFLFPEWIQLHVHGHRSTDVGPTLAKRMCDLCRGSR